MKPLPPNLLQCLRVVAAHCRECQDAPTLRWMATALEVEQRTAKDYLVRLVRLGLLSPMDSMRPRPTPTPAGYRALQEAA